MQDRLPSSAQGVPAQRGATWGRECNPKLQDWFENSIDHFDYQKSWGLESNTAKGTGRVRKSLDLGIRRPGFNPSFGFHRRGMASGLALSELPGLHLGSASGWSGSLFFTAVICRVY